MMSREFTEPEFARNLLPFALSRWRLKNVRFVRWFENAVYSAELEDLRVYLRVTPASRRTLVEIESELSILEFLKASDFPSTFPVPTADGHLIALGCHQDSRYYLTLFSECPGDEYQVKPEERSDRFFRACGRTMGYLHHLLRDYQPQRAFSRPLWQSDRWSSFAEVVPASEKDAWRTYEEFAGWWESLENAVETQLIHGDFTIRNLRYGKRGISLFDFDGCCEHYAGYEIGCFFHAFRLAPYEFRRTLASEFLSGYSEINGLTEGLVERLPMFCRMKLLRSFIVLCEESNRTGRKSLDEQIAKRRVELRESSPWVQVIDV